MVLTDLWEYFPSLKNVEVSGDIQLCLFFSGKIQSNLSLLSHHFGEKEADKFVSRILQLIRENKGDLKDLEKLVIEVRMISNAYKFFLFDKGVNLFAQSPIYFY